MKKQQTLYIWWPILIVILLILFYIYNNKQVTNIEPNSIVDLGGVSGEKMYQENVSWTTENSLDMSDIKQNTSVKRKN